MEFGEYLRILRSSWRFVLVAGAVGLVLALVASLVATPQYRSTAQLYVSARSSSSGIDDLVQGTDYSRQIVVSYVDVAKTSLVLKPVIEALELDLTSAELSRLVAVESPKDTVLVNISATSTDPQLAADIANTTGESFSHVVQTQLEGDLSSQRSGVQLTLVEPAVPADAPDSPNILFNLAAGLLLGLALGAGLALVRSITDTRIRSMRNIDEFSDKPILGGIHFDPEAKDRPLVCTELGNPRVEAFRSLRTNIQSLDLGEGGRSIVVTSAGPAEGKSVTTVNLAISLAEAGSRVVLVEGNLRRPRVAEYMGVESRVGLTDVLSGKAKIDDVMHQWGKGQLGIIPAGKTVANARELLGSVVMDNLIQELAGSYDYVLIDCPPVLLVTDAAVVGQKASGVVVVVASGSTKKHAFDTAQRTLESAGAKILGLIVTKLPTKGPDSYGYDAGGYGYGVEESQLHN